MHRLKWSLLTNVWDLNARPAHLKHFWFPSLTLPNCFEVWVRTLLLYGWKTPKSALSVSGVKWVKLPSCLTIVLNIFIYYASASNVWWFENIVRQERAGNDFVHLFDFKAHSLFTLCICSSSEDRGHPAQTTHVIPKLWTSSAETHEVRHHRTRTHKWRADEGVSVAPVQLCRLLNHN